jgi:hypothetical protein
MSIAGEIVVQGKRFTSYIADNVGCLLRLAQAAGVSSTTRLIGKSLNPGRTSDHIVMPPAALTISPLSQ